jgi:hypothetical protein
MFPTKVDYYKNGQKRNTFITGEFSNKLCGKKFVQNNLRSPHGQHCKEVFALTDLLCANDEQIFNWVSCSTWFRYRNQGCQIFSWYSIPKRGKIYQIFTNYTKYPQIIPNIHRIHEQHKIYQTAVEWTKWH